MFFRSSTRSPPPATGGFMKMFWSWQSDKPGKIGPHFVRDALKLAIESLKQAPEVEEPTAAETRDSIHLDHDRQGVTGSPDLARTIFDVGRASLGDRRHRGGGRRAGTLNVHCSLRQARC